MFITILKINGEKVTKKPIAFDVVGKPYKWIPDKFEDEAQYDRWFEWAFDGRFMDFHIRRSNRPETHEFEGLMIHMKFS